MSPMNRAARRELALSCVLAASAGGCGGQGTARDQWEVFVGTDAPIPQLGQELLVEMLDESGQPELPASVRFIDATHAAWPVSFGVVPDGEHARPRVRVRLYRLDETGSDGLPTGAALLDATASLPPPSGVTRVGLALAMACFGVAADPGGRRTCDPTTKQLVAEPTLHRAVDPTTLPRPGSWPDAARVPCLPHVAPGMTCAPGGAFLLGTQHFFRDTTDTDPLPQRLVVLHPFAIDTAEVTVGQVRSLVRAEGLQPPIEQGATASAGVRTEACTYRGVNDASNDDAPANCLPWVTADRACRAMGKRLPTEAEWEYVARNLDEETTYPWGSDPAVCDYAVVARGYSVYVDATECEPSGSTTPPGPVAGGSALDKTALGVLNLGGNVSEWVADFFAPYSGACWSVGVPLIDPSCESSSMGHSIRGGSWQDAVTKASSTSRSVSDADGASEAVGFRCAMSM